MSPTNTLEQERRGTWWQRVLIAAFSVLLTLLIYWLLGFVLRDIGRLPGPNWNDFETARIDPALPITAKELETSIADVQRQIENVTRRQNLLRNSTASSQKTLSQLLELLRISIEQQSVLPDEQQRALAESQQLFLENQKQDQAYNESLSQLQEQLADLQEQQRLHRADSRKPRNPSSKSSRDSASNTTGKSQPSRSACCCRCCCSGGGSSPDTAPANTRR